MCVRPELSSRLIPKPRWLGRGFLLIAAVVSANLAGGSPANASTPGVSLRYEVEGEACPDRAQFESWVSSRLGRQVFVDNQEASLVIRVAGADHLVVTAELQGSSTTLNRTFSGARTSCFELLEACASAVAIALDVEDDSAKEAPPAQTTSPVIVAPEVRRSRPPLPKTRSSVAPVAVESTRWELGLLGLAHGPTPMLGGGLSLEAYPSPSWSLGVRADWQVSVEDVALEGGDSSRLQFVGATFPACAWRNWIGGCMSARVGVLSSHVSDVSNPERSTALVAFGPEIFGSFPLSKNLRGRAMLQLHVPTTRPTIEIDGQPVWTFPVATASLGIGVSGVLD